MSRRISAVTATKLDAGNPPPQMLKTAEGRRDLAALTPALDKSKVYIFHVDALPALHKRRIFYIPLSLNAAILALVLWRAYAAAPTYMAMLWAALGQQTAATVDTKRASWAALLWMVLRRSTVMLVDLFIFRIVGSWPYTFFCEWPENPCSYRWKLGFRERELVVRVSRNWGAEDLLGGTKRGVESPFWKTRVAPAISPVYIREKTGYLMMGKDWDLDFDVMVRGQRILDGREVSEKQFHSVVFGCVNDEWMLWDVANGQAQGVRLDEQGMTVEEGNRQMQMLRERLAEMGKEDLFFRMIELVQYEGSTPGEFGGFSADKQQATLARIKKLFTDNGVDFQKLLDSMGIDLPTG